MFYSKKTYIILCCSILTSIIFLSKNSFSDTQKNLPNIIFVLTDDQRWDSVGFMGQKIGKTPNLDQLASESSVFEKAFVTSAICTPSRTTYFLGQYERKHGVNFNSGTALSKNAWKLSYPMLLREAGYTTAYIGKNHVPIGKEGYAGNIFKGSFDFWYAGNKHLGFYPKKRHPIFSNSVHETQTEILQQGAQAFLDKSTHGKFYDTAKEFLHQRDEKKPFCLTLSLNLPHSYSVSRMEQKIDDDELYKSTYRKEIKSIPLPPFYVSKEALSQPKLPKELLLQERRQKSYDWVNTEILLRERLIRTMQTVTGIDRMIGELRLTLKKLNIHQNTILIFTSDHGLQYGEFGLGGKALCYDTCLRVPLIIYDPREQGAKRISNLVQSIDIAPTLLDFAGISIPKAMQGKSLLPLMRSEKINWRDAAFGENLWSTEYGNPRCETIRTSDFRYIRYFQNHNLNTNILSKSTAQSYKESLTSTILGEPAVYEELYHTSIDPYESKNLINNIDYKNKVKELRDICDDLVRFAKGSINQPPDTVKLEI